MRVTNDNYRKPEQWVMNKFQSPICGSQTMPLIRLNRNREDVSIPYMRVTNLKSPCHLFATRLGFNPLYAGHKPFAFEEELRKFQVSIPYMRVTNYNLAAPPGKSFLVSIPYMRVTNRLPHLLFSPLFVCFNPLYAGHKQPHSRGFRSTIRVSIPYMRVTNMKE